MLTVNAVPSGGPLRPGSCIIGSSRRSTCSSVRVRQMRPRPWVAMKLMASGVTNSRGHAEVALVLAVLVVDEDDHLAGADVVEGARHAESIAAVIAGAVPASRRAWRALRFEVDAVADRERAERRVLAGVRDDRDRQRLGVDGVDGQRHAGDRNRALLDDVAQQARRRAHAEHEVGAEVAAGRELAGRRRRGRSPSGRRADRRRAARARGCSGCRRAPRRAWCGRASRRRRAPCSRRGRPR